MKNVCVILNDDKAKFNFLKGLICLSKATEIKEGVIGINTQEKMFLETAMKAIDINKNDQSILNALINAKENDDNISFENSEQALFFLREGIQICNIDGNYSDEERKLVYSLAKKLGVSKASVAIIENWVEAGRKWEEKGDALLKLK